jgi:hypothetical protein
MREAVLVSNTITQIPVDKDSHHSRIFIFKPPESSQEARFDADFFQDLHESMAFCEEFVVKGDWIAELEDCDLSAHDCFCREYYGWMC